MTPLKTKDGIPIIEMPSLDHLIIRKNKMSNAVEMPKYLCNKQVWALKIKRVDINHQGKALLLIEDKGFAPVEVSKEYVDKHQPEAGGYYVVYLGGYKSFSPADAFEDGYTIINK